MVMGEEEVVNQQGADTQKIKDECDANLADVMATLNEAVATLNSLTPNDITVIKAMKTPPPKGIRLLMEAVCMLKVMYVHVHYV
jgi:dynein heavy chain